MGDSEPPEGEGARIFSLSEVLRVRSRGKKKKPSLFLGV